MAKPTRYTPEMFAEYGEKGYWGTTTLADLWDRNARDYPDKEAVVDSKTRLTWAQAKQWINRLALGFLELGIKKGEVIVIQLPNCVELCLLRLACEKVGALCLPILRTFRHKEMEYLLNYTEAVGVVIPWVFRDFDHFKMITELRPNLPRLKHVFVVGDEVPEGATSIKQMTQDPLENRYPSDYLERTKCPANEFSLILQTTGTTGFPKFVESPICSRVCMGKLAGEVPQVTGDDILAALVPAAAGPNVMVYFTAPQVAAKAVMLEHFEAEEALRLIEKERVTIFGVPGAVLAMMVKHPSFDRYDLSSLRFVWTGFAPIPYELAIEAEKKLGLPITQGYGTMDSGGATKTTSDEPLEVRLQTVGKPYDGNEVKLVDESGEEVVEGIGEIWFKGPGLASGYYKDPEATWQVWTPDGWFKTGDRGRFDERGYLLVVGRKKDMIIRGGQNIYPAEVEDMLNRHPKVSDVAIIGMPDPIMGERACAYVIPKPGQDFTFEEMISFLKGENFAPYKLPERLEIVDSLPMVGEQKVDKKVLQEDITQKLKAEGKA